MTRKEMPVVLTLAALAATALIVYYKGYGLITMLIALLAVFCVFYFIGTVIRMVLDSFYAENKKRKEEEGEVIEKEPSKDENPAEGKAVEKTEENVIKTEAGEE
ncbi:MAG: hypothetical protein J6U37_06345 [Lachnospiraceae bacterium]|nr:hypothetical protein [Lachnospiraceae bacterium]